MEKRRRMLVLGTAVAVVVIAVVVVAAVMGARRGAAAQPPVVEAPPLVPLADFRRPPEAQIVPTALTGRRGRRLKNYNLGTESTEDSKTLLKDLLALVEQGDEDSVGKALRECGRLETPELLAFARQSLGRISNAEFRQDLVRELGGLATKQVLPLFQQASKDASHEVRIEVLDALVYFDARRQSEMEQPEKLSAEEMQGFAKLVGDAMSDPNEEVRKRALENLREFPAEVQLTGLQAAMKSSDKSTRAEALDLIALDSNKDTALLAMAALKDSDGDIVERAQELLEKMTDQKFATYDAAVTWWNANSRRFDYDMQEKPEE